MANGETASSLAGAAARALINYLGHHSAGAALEQCLKTLEKEGFSREQIRAAVDEVARENRITITVAEGDVTPMLQVSREPGTRAPQELEPTSLF